MSEIKVLATGSKGNAYILTADNGEQLLLDAGIKRSDIVQGLDFSIDRLCGCLITHAHTDHCKSATEIEMMGVPTWHPYRDENKRQIRKFGVYSIQSFPVPHDGENCVGYYIKFYNRKLLYMTDLEYCPYSFVNQGITDLLIEVNYQQKYLETNAANFVHKVLGHFSLEGCLDFIEHNQTASLANIIICHMSSYTMDVDECISEIKRITMPTVNVSAARKGRTIQL